MNQWEKVKGSPYLNRPFIFGTNHVKRLKTHDERNQRGQIEMKTTRTVRTWEGAETGLNAAGFLFYACHFFVCFAS